MLQWPTRNTVTIYLDMCQKVITIAALIVGGIWSYKLFIEHRDSYSKADIQHDVSTFVLGDDRMLIRLTVSIHNTGNTLLQLTECDSLIEQVLPLDRMIVDEISSTTNALYDKAARFAWPVITMKKLKWMGGEFEIEPGEHDRLIVEFIIRHPPDIINISTHFPNPYRQRHIGWGYSTIVDLRQAENR